MYRSKPKTLRNDAWSMVLKNAIINETHIIPYVLLPIQAEGSYLSYIRSSVGGRLGAYDHAISRCLKILFGGDTSLNRWVSCTWEGGFNRLAPQKVAAGEREEEEEEERGCRRTTIYPSYCYGGCLIC